MNAAASIVRARVRRVVRRLPAAAQLWIKRADAALRRSDWAGSVEHLRIAERAYIEHTVAQGRTLAARQRILFLALQSSPPWSEIECGLAMALALRGHDVRGILCDGVLPVCEMSLGARERPPCAACVGWRQRYAERAFGFEWTRLTNFLSAEDRADATRRVDGVPPADWQSLVIDDIPVGQFARRELQRYRRGFVFDPAADPAYRDWLVTGLLLVRLMTRLIERERPDVVVASSGRTLASACLVAVARAHGTRVVTWDTEPTFADALSFSHDRPAVEVPLDDVWREVADRPLTSAEAHRLRGFLRKWARSENTPFPYNPQPLEGEGAVRAHLGLAAGRPLVVAFTNTSWDMAVVDRDVGFANMFEWVFSLVEYAIAHPDISLVVRAHPAEVKVPADVQSRTPVPAEILKRFGPLPPNIALVAGDSPISSYVLARMADIVMAYSSRIGLEVALTGKRPWLCGDVTYRGKGFTRDVASREEMVRLLDRRPFDERMPPAEIELAERFAHLWFFRGVIRVPLLRPARRPFSLKSFRELGPEGDAVIAQLCDAITTGAPFIT